MAATKLPYTVAFADEMHADGIARARELFDEVLLWSDSDYTRWIEEADGICNRAKVIPTEHLIASKKLRVLSKQGVGGEFLARVLPAHGMLIQSEQWTPSTSRLVARRASRCAIRQVSTPMRESRATHPYSPRDKPY